jgi:hypothetical protein
MNQEQRIEFIKSLDEPILWNYEYDDQGNLCSCGPDWVAFDKDKHLVIHIYQTPQYNEVIYYDPAHHESLWD